MKVLAGKILVFGLVIGFIFGALAGDAGAQESSSGDDIEFVDYIEDDLIAPEPTTSLVPPVAPIIRPPADSSGGGTTTTTSTTSTVPETTTTTVVVPTTTTTIPHLALTGVDNVTAVSVALASFALGLALSALSWTLGRNEGDR
jgi:hypothetical protein